ncbi:hypothetical protein N0V95_003090 [Ascochyta clinopodiicola]|nr:hypothetical protein N0V95_003090 [Ascochyta clinopodiicola]
MEYESIDVLVDGNGTSETLEIAAGNWSSYFDKDLNLNKQHGRASAIALNSQESGAAESESRFRVLSVNIDYLERYPALAGFEKLVHDHGYDTLLKPYDYTTTPERLHFIAYCLILPEAFDAEHLLREREACSEWLMTLDFDCRINSNTEEQDKAYIKMYGIGNDLPDMAAYIEHPDITARATFQEAVHAADPSRIQQRLKKMRP